MKRVSSLLAVVLAVACSDAFQPTIDNVAGDYTARTLTITDSTGTTDVLKAGGVLTLSLVPRGTTAGYLYIPGAVAGGSDVIADMVGTWTMSSGIIYVSGTADTFMRDMGFIAGKRRLDGSKVFSGVRVQIVLIK